MRSVPRRRASPRLRIAQLGIVLALCAVAAHAAPAAAQDASMLDPRVTQQSIGNTICRPDYADSVSPSVDTLMAMKARLLAERGISKTDGTRYALDRRVPVLLGGSPDAVSNLELLPWAGANGERRKARLAVRLKHCVCEGKMTLGDAQAQIFGNWAVDYPGFGDHACSVGSEASSSEVSSADIPPADPTDGR